jgi:hypothetical protein
LSFTIGEPDLDAPDAPAELWYDVYDNELIATTSWTSCGGSVDARYEITVRAEIEEERLEYPLEFRLSRRPRNSPEGWVVVENGWLLGEEESYFGWFRWLYHPSEVGSLLPLATAFCLRLETFDPSENLGGAIEVCPPCRDQVGGEPPAFTPWPDSPPKYTDDWRYPGGYCPASLEPEDGDGAEGGHDGSGTDGEPSTGSTSAAGATSSGDASTESTGDDPSSSMNASGCTCSSASRPAIAWLFGVPLLLLLVSRRHSVPSRCARSVE